MNKPATSNQQPATSKLKLFLLSTVILTSITSMAVAMDQAQNPGQALEPTGRPPYNEEDFQKWMLMQEAAREEHGVPDDVSAQNIGKKMHEVSEDARAVKEAEEWIEKWVLIRDNSKFAMLKESSDTPSEQFSNRILKVLCMQYPDIEHLIIKKCPNLTHLAPLSNLSDLIYLDLSKCTEIQDLTPLKNLSSLLVLNLNKCTGIQDLTPLKGLSLDSLMLNGCTAIPQENIEELIRHLPTKCKIIMPDGTSRNGTRS